MSHQPERIEKNCLNCGTDVQGRYCHVCGQENIVTHQGFWSLCRHFIYDVLHYDGKFIDTFKYLLLRPGFVPKEYINGKRQSYLDPIRMYLFTSAIFFLIFFSIKSPEDGIGFTGDNDYLTRQERVDKAAIISHQLVGGSNDSLLQKQLVFLLDTGYRIKLTPAESLVPGDTAMLIRANGKTHRMIVEKIDTANTDSLKGGWIERKFTSSIKKARRKYGDDDRAILSAMANSFMHKFPYMLFVSLPFFALTLKLLYVRRKKFFYSDHAVFTLYHYIFMFILLLFFFLFESLQRWTGFQFFQTLRVLLLISGILYLFMAMKKYYLQGWKKTLVKFLALNFIALIGLLLLVLVFILLSFFQI